VQQKPQDEEDAEYDSLLSTNAATITNMIIPQFLN
jgi:hypothetical protein